MNSMKNLEDIDEEFNNFMHKVNDVCSIVKKLGSKDKHMQEIGTAEADRYLNDKTETICENLCEGMVQLKVKTNRTVINKKALVKDDTDPNSMSQEAFMKSVSKDADMRYKDKLIRQEKADTLKTQANKAFRRGEYEKALTLYDKAIEQIKDSCMLFTNRALTQINLQRYDKAIEDAERALRLNENSLKARLLLAKTNFLCDNIREFEDAVKEAKKQNQNQVEFIDEFVNDLKKNK